MLIETVNCYNITTPSNSDKRISPLRFKIMLCGRLGQYQTREQVVEKWQKTHTSNPNEVKIKFVGEITSKKFFEN